MDSNENGNIVAVLIQKQDDLMKDLTEIKVILARQEENLKIHMKRSDQLEKYVSTLESNIKPIQKHVYFIEGFLKFTGGIAAILSTGMGVYKLYTMLF